MPAETRSPAEPSAPFLVASVAGVVDVSPSAMLTIRPAARVIGPSDIGGLMMSPAIFASLKPGGVLDEDPVTKNRTIYTGPADGLLGVVERGPARRFQYGYDPQRGLQRTLFFTFGGTGMMYRFQLVER